MRVSFQVKSMEATHGLGLHENACFWIFLLLWINIFFTRGCIYIAIMLPSIETLQVSLSRQARCVQMICTCNWVMSDEMQLSDRFRKSSACPLYTKGYWKKLTKFTREFMYRLGICLFFCFVLGLFCTPSCGLFFVLQVYIRFDISIAAIRKQSGVANARSIL